MEYLNENHQKFVESKQTILAQVQGIYDLQGSRVAIGNRIVANFKSKLGIQPSVKEDSKEKKLLEEIRGDYKRITDSIVLNEELDKRFKKNYKMPVGKLISSQAEYSLIYSYEELLKQEELQIKQLKNQLENFPIYSDYLLNIKGCGTLMSGVIISFLDPYRAKYPSSFRKYCGIDVGEDGKGRSKRSEHLREYEYVAKDGTTKTKKGITFNPFVKTKLLGVLGTSFIKCKSPYSEIYYNEKTKLKQKESWSEASDKHIHTAAIRKMISIFLIHLHIEWRRLENLPVSAPYEEAKLGLFHLSNSVGEQVSLTEVKMPVFNHRDAQKLST